MSILFFIDKLLFRAIKGNNLFLAARNLLRVVEMCCWKIWPRSNITPKYLYRFDNSKSILFKDILYLSLLSCLKCEKRMDSVLLTLIATLYLANQVESSLRCFVIAKIL